MTGRFVELTEVTFGSGPFAKNTTHTLHVRPEHVQAFHEWDAAGPSIGRKFITISLIGGSSHTLAMTIDEVRGRLEYAG